MQKKRRNIVLTSLLLLIGAQLQAQQMIGTTGGFNIPTAEMQPSGTFLGGINYIGKGMIAGENTKRADDCWNFEYNTGLFYFNFTPFSWLEVSFGETMLRSKYTKYNKPLDDYEYQRTDRLMTFRVRPLKETTFLPAIVIGANDPWQDTGHNVYSSAYIVGSKHIHSRLLASEWLVTLGYAKSFDKADTYNGILGGIKYTPDFWKEGSLSIEYDSKGVNVGLQARFFHHISLFAFTRDFSIFNAGIRYEYTIKY